MRITVFDADSGGYAELASEPIPITVHPTREVTLLDVEGGAVERRCEPHAERSGGKQP